MWLLQRSGFRLHTLPWRPDWWSAAKQIFRLEGSPISTEDLWSSVRVTIGFLVTALLPRLLSLARRSTLGRVLVVPNFFHLIMMEATVFLGTFNAADSRSVPRHNPVSELYEQFLQPHGLVFALTCTVNCGTLYRHGCAFPNHVPSIEIIRGGLQSSWRNISRMINGNRMHLSSILSLIAKVLNTYANKVFLFFVFNSFAKNVLNNWISFVIMGFCV